MESVDSYLSEILAAITPLQPEDIPLTEAQGAVLAADAVTSWPVPGFDNSAMDGYAVRAADVAGASAENPVTLPVDAEIAAGDTGACTLAPGRSIKIMTGALLPAGADAVIPVEWTDDGRQTVRISRPAALATRSAGRVTTLSPATCCFRRAPGWARLRSGCSPRPGTGPSWLGAARGSRSSRRAMSSPSRGRRWFPAGSGTPTATCWPRPPRRPAARRPGIRGCVTNPTRSSPRSSRRPPTPTC